MWEIFFVKYIYSFKNTGLQNFTNTIYKTHNYEKSFTDKT